MSDESKAEQYLRELVEALETAFISSWQSTAAWQKELDAARNYLDHPMTTEQLLRRAIDCLEILNQRDRPMCRDCADMADDGVCPNSGLNCDMRALISQARAALSAPAQPASGEAVEFDGYKGEHQVRWYINELNRVRIINQWLADVYCNELRKFYKAKHAAHVKDERDIELRASNDLADLWRSCKDLVESYWLPGGDKPEDMTPFERFHDEVTKRLLSVFADPTPPTSQEQADDCARSHPHEDMSPMCELRTQIARLKNENTRLKASQEQAQPAARVAKSEDYVHAACGEIFASDHTEPGAYDLAIWRKAEASHGIGGISGNGEA